MKMFHQAVSWLRKADKMSEAIPNPQRQYTPFVSYSSVFTREECAQIKTLGAKCEGVAATIEDNRMDESRKSEVGWIVFTEETRWLYERLDSSVNSANDFYRFDLHEIPVTESLQYTVYRHGDHYSWHRDGLEMGLEDRKLTAVAYLDDPRSYDGGNLELLSCNIARKFPPRNQGDVVVFPSFEHHRVTPVSAGVRTTLVAWASGPAFR